MRNLFRRGGLWMVAVLLIAGVGAARAEDYVLGADDVLQVSVWLHPELERTVTIAGDGTIVYPPIGSLAAAGLTPKQLGDKLANQLGTFLRQTTAVTVTVSQFMSRSVFVSGAVSKPGRYGFEHIPGLIDAISQAGGVVAGADLAHVQVIRKEGDNRRTIEADVAASLRDGVGSTLPQLKPGDTVLIPSINAPGQAPGAGEGVGVIGQVVRPGLYTVNGTSDVWSVLAAAGGVSALGDLGSVNVITRQGAGQAVATINLREALKHGTRAPFLVRTGDVIFVPSTADRGGGRAWAAFQLALGATRDVVSLVLLRDIVRR
ncbi:MAG: polysaccharide export protein [Candidatus Eisenbacteria bacterium]|uniref:Polysaccharide export protein n=1 Tax=Eiseniibacteriota bacterium TaxID=2212470 RepID=A0A9D6L9D2_UNCEI|nr:polysaccharide export protein [Candidatus Eisenbacteria bacterium]MBI3539380.1 polysaccharide export protein [Candidatus Eisenbacteria bacterium]